MSWDDWYSSYLRSPRWEELKRRVLARDKMCVCCTSPATEVHHKTYAHVGSEDMDDLCGMCSRHHEAITNSNREHRYLKDVTVPANHKSEIFHTRREENEERNIEGQGNGDTASSAPQWQTFRPVR